MPVLAGLAPGVTVTEIAVEAPGSTLAGLAEATPLGEVEVTVTVSAIDAAPVRFCASVMVTGSVFAPAVVLPLTVAVKVQVLLP